MKRKRGGFVLVVALGALAVMALLLLSLMQGTKHQAHGAEGAAVMAREKMLADSAVALVMGQIQQASTQPSVAWISQPGLLRTFGTSRQPLKSYKLYSADSLTDTSGSVNFLAGEIPADWNSTANANRYVDLNAPQSMSTLFGVMLSPIYPILDPGALGSVQGVSSDSGSVAMPVAWLYELQDGTIGPASAGTKQNPIVGRIAFWTDDETCKINLNTASDGVAWNAPHFNTADDSGWATAPPVEGECSSYPGHPAMTSLAPVFGALSRQQLLSLSPRYAWGGSQGGTQATVAGQTMTPKVERLYASVDELCFNGQRATGLVTPAQIEQARFVLTAHSEAPETNLLGEPRVAIWPIGDAPAKTTAIDRAIASDATIGSAANARAYYFQRGDPASPTDDFGAGSSNDTLFQELKARGGEAIPGYGTDTFAQKYPCTQWPQILVEMADFVRGLNAIDPTGPVFAATRPGSHVGRGFIVPLSMADPSGAMLRGFGRCPTLSSVMLVVYVCGFGFDDGTPDLDFDLTPDDLAGTAWNQNFSLQADNKWNHVDSELLRAFVVPCTFHPGCAFPEVSDACELQISGFDSLTVTNLQNGDAGGFAFPATMTSGVLGTPPTRFPADRAWGGNDGPVAWRAVGDAGGVYPFAGGRAFKFKVGSKPVYNSATKLLTPPSSTGIKLSSVNLTVVIRDSTSHATLQTVQMTLPSISVAPPSIDREADHYDAVPPAPSNGNWTSDSSLYVHPSWYMCLANRLRATQGNKPLMIQPGDVAYQMEAATDLRVIAALGNVASSFFHLCVNPFSGGTNAMLHNLRFADGTSALGSCGTMQASVTAPYGPVASVTYPKTTQPSIAGTSWSNGQSVAISNPWFTSPTPSLPTSATNAGVNMSAGVKGDWDNGPGFCPDGAMINLPDAGSSLVPDEAYRSLTASQAGAPTRFAANALVPSPIVFGSLPAGINPSAPASSQPWRTLLFCPYPAAGTAHPGFVSPPDHLLLDQFWMPVVEPYGISTRMATAGKINLNDQIAPFTYLHRNTGLHALLHDLRIPVVTGRGQTYKSPGAPLAAGTIWQAVDENATIAQWESRFAQGDAYLSESEICTQPIIPQGAATSDMNAFWNKVQTGAVLTGDNLRELPYAQIYSRLATRSNSFTVHVRVQVLKKLTMDPQQNIWREGTDVVLGDWRGSYEIERYLDTTASAPVAASATGAGGQLGPYRFRVVSARRFSP